MSDYKNMDAPTMLSDLGVDAQKWADAFLQINEGKLHQLDKGDMIGWFSNAMMAMHDHLHGNPVLCGDHAQYLLEKEKPHE